MRTAHTIAAASLILVVAGCQDGTPAPDGRASLGAIGGQTSIGISAASVTEGDEGTTELAFTLTLDAPSRKDINVDFLTADQTATAGSDYNAAAGTVTFPRGSSMARVRIQIIGDMEVENDESFKLTLSNPVNAILKNSEATGTILNDDTGTVPNDNPPPPPAPQLGIAPASTAEGNSGSSSMTFTISLDRPAEKEVSVEFSTSDGSAKAGSDYQAASGKATIPAGETSTTISVQITGDTSVEQDETFRIVLNNPANAILQTAEAIGTILNDDSAPPPQLGIAPASTAEGNSGSSNMTFTISLDRPAEKEVTMEFSTSDGSAKAGSDYQAASGKATIPAGETSTTISVQITGDTLVESDETFTLSLNNPVNAQLGTAQATGTILNDDADPPPRIDITSASVEEGDSGSRQLSFTVTLDSSSEKETSVAYATTDGTAVAGSDYQTANGRLTIPGGETSGIIQVSINGDTDVESDEIFHIVLSEPQNAVLGTDRATGSIIDDDVAAETPQISIASASIEEGDSGTANLEFTVSLDKAADNDASVTFSTADITATAGSDYQARSGTLTIPAGSTSAIISVAISGDLLVESNETFRITLGNPLNATLQSSVGTGTILNDDAAVADGPCTPSGNGTDYPVGPGQSHASIADVPWGELGPGDTVRIHYRPEPYREKIVISTSGSVQNPIKVCGVAGPNGERPILDGDGAVNDPDDASGYGTYRPMEGLAMVMLYNRDYDLKVHNVVIEGLHIRNAKNNFSYTRMDGSTARYENGAACIRIQAADNVVIRDNELENCANGIFTMSQEHNEAHLTRNLLIEGNYLHGHGQNGSYYEHGLYIQAIGVTYQYNRFGPNTPGSGGTTLKERAAGSIIRYNWFDSGSSRALDIVEVEDAAPWYIEQEYRNWAAANGQPIDTERLRKVREAEAGYRKTYVYGNFFRHVGSQTSAANILHYGSDNDPALSRAGTLYFYNNTVSIRQDRSDAWRFRLFYLGNRNASTPSRERIEVFNNIIHLTGESGTPSHFCLNDVNGGTISFGINWMTNSWQESTAQSECYYGNPADGPTVTGVENLLDISDAPAPIDQDTLAPLNRPMLRGTAQAVQTGHPVDRMYVRHQKSAERSSADDLGAMEIP